MPTITILIPTVCGIIASCVVGLWPNNAYGQTDKILETPPAVYLSRQESLPQLHELPWNVRKDLPELKLSLHYYALEPTERFVKFGDRQRVMEDAVLGQELWLRKIRADGVVIEFRDRFFLLKH